MPIKQLDYQSTLKNEGVVNLVDKSVNGKIQNKHNTKLSSRNQYHPSNQNLNSKRSITPIKNTNNLVLI
jgi:hypothetical protein